MRRLILVFIFLWTLGNIGMSQIEVRVFSGYDITPVVTSGISGGFGYDDSNTAYQMRGYLKRTLENKGNFGVSLRIPMKKIVFDLDFYAGRFRLSENKRQDYYRFLPGGQEQLYYTSDRTAYSRSIYLGGKFCVGYSITKNFIAKLFFGNFGTASYMTGLALDKNLGKHWNVGLSAYNPIAMGVESGWKLEKSYGVGFQLGYRFIQKEKSKRSNSVPTVL